MTNDQYEPTETDLQHMIDHFDDSNHEAYPDRLHHAVADELFLHGHDPDDLAWPRYYDAWLIALKDSLSRRERSRNVAEWLDAIRGLDFPDDGPQFFEEMGE